MATLPELLKTMVDMEGSDLHIATNTPPQVRVHGHLRRLQLPEFTPAETKTLVYSVLTDSQKKRFEETMELDFSFGIRGMARFRCNVFNQRGAVGAVYRLIPETIRSFGELGLPPVLANLAELDAQLAKEKKFDRLNVEGGWYAVLRVPATRPDEEVAIELLEKQDVYVHPGHFYDFPADGYLVVSLITPEHEFKEGIDRLLSAM